MQILPTESVLRSKSFGVLLRLVFGVGVLFLLSRFVDVSSALEAMSEARLLPLAASLALLGASVALGGIGVVILARARCQSMEWGLGLSGYAKAWALGFALGRVSELLLPLFWREHMEVGESAAVVVLDKLISLMWILGFSIFGIFFFISHETAFVFLAAALGAAATLAALIRYVPAGRFSKWLPGTVRAQTVLMGNTLVSLRSTGRSAILLNTAITGVRTFLHGGILVALLASLSTSVPVMIATAVQALTQLTSFIPGTIMGIGLWESVYVVTLGQLSVPGDVALAASFLGRMVSLMLLVPLAVVAWGSYVGAASSPSSPKVLGPQAQVSIGKRPHTEAEQACKS